MPTMNGDENLKITGWGLAPDRADYQRQLKENPLSFIEIKRLPKKMEPRTLVSMIASVTKILPKIAEIVFTQDIMDRVALVEFKTPLDAFKAIDRLRMSPLSKSWRMTLMSNPKFLEPPTEVVDKCNRRL